MIAKKVPTFKIINSTFLLGYSHEKSLQAGKNHGLEFIESSAKTNVNIGPAFIRLAEMILEKKRKEGMIEGRERGMAGDVQKLGKSVEGGKSLCNTCS